MHRNSLLKTNVIISAILIVGFILTAILSYQANYQYSLANIEHISSLTAEGIYYQLTTRLSKPINISMTMAHDHLLLQHLEQEKMQLNNPEYVETTKNYLDAYRDKYNLDSVFLVSAATNRYYNFSGIDRVLTPDNAENEWYYEFMNSGLEYSLNVDNDEVNNADNDITVFINCKIYDAAKSGIGVVGVGIRIHYLQQLLQSYEEQYGIEASLVDENGDIQISTSDTGYERKNWFVINEQESLREQLLSKQENNLELWTSADAQSQERSYLVSRYIPELSWTLIVAQDTGLLVKQIEFQIFCTLCILIAVIITILVIITSVIRKFKQQVTDMVEERQRVFKQATEQLYDNIYEINITKNRCADRYTEEYFESLGAKDLPYDQGLLVMVQRQIKEEFQKPYLAKFSPQNVIKEYNNGNDHLQYDFMMTQDGNEYFWMRIDAYVFYAEEDKSLHMFVYRKNIAEEKHRELLSITDGMTGFYTKTETERMINDRIAKNPNDMQALFICDIDNFKQANDRYGHAFGDFCIHEFVSIMQQSFRRNDILGRVGGDEFVAFITAPDLKSIIAKGEALTHSLHTLCTQGEASWQMSASIGIALTPKHGKDFTMLYQHADTALYQVKKAGKNGFKILEL